jgi:hypothetical protein
MVPPSMLALWTDRRSTYGSTVHAAPQRRSARSFRTLDGKSCGIDLTARCGMPRLPPLTTIDSRDGRDAYSPSVPSSPGMNGTIHGTTRAAGVHKAGFTGARPGRRTRFYRGAAAGRRRRRSGHEHHRACRTLDRRSFARSRSGSVNGEWRRCELRARDVSP